MKPKILAVAAGGTFMAVLTTVPGLNIVNCFCCSGLIVGGIVTVYVYKKNDAPQLPMRIRTGLQLGLLAGLFATLLNTVVALLFPIDIFHQLAELTDNFVDPGVVPWPQSLDSVLAGRGFVLITFFSSLVLNTLFGSLGGMFGTFMFGDKEYKQRPQTNKENDDDDVIVEDIQF